MVHLRETPEKTLEKRLGFVLKPYVPLHLHTEYSTLDGVGKPQEIVQRAKELGHPACAITDHGTMAGVVGFYSAAKKAGVKPIIGCEFYTTPLGRACTERVKYDEPALRNHHSHQRNNYHLIILAKDYRGYENMNELMKLSYAKGFYYRPRIDHEALEHYKEGLIVSSACILGEVNHAIEIGNMERAKETARWYQSVFGEDFYLETMSNGYAPQLDILPGIREISKELGIPTIVTNDSHYVYKEQSLLQKDLMLLGFNQTRAEYAASKGAAKDPILDMSAELYMKDYEEMLLAVPDCGDELDRTLEVAEKCNLELPLGELKIPKYDITTDNQYPEFEKSLFSIPESVKENLAEAVATPNGEGVVSPPLSEDEWGSLTFLRWLCEKGMETLVEPKFERFCIGGSQHLEEAVLAEGEKPDTVEEMSGYIVDPPKNFQVVHLHNSPDQLWFADKTAEEARAIYRERLDYELEVVSKMHYLDYFLIVQEYVNQTRFDGKTPGPGRGSGAGSLMLYLSGITSIDPIPSDLMFERFLNPDRISMPDIDCDFPKEYRLELMQHVKERYGYDHASQVATFSFFAGKGALRAAGRLLAINPAGKDKFKDLADELAKLVDDKPSTQLRDELGKGGNPPDNMVLYRRYGDSADARKLMDLALQLEGRLSGDSIHACAYIIAPEKITNKMPMMVPKTDREAAEKTGEEIKKYVIQLDGHTVEEQGYLKMDFLGLINLDAMDMAAQMIEKAYGSKVFIENIPLDDKAVFDLLCSGLLSGLFQLGSDGMWNVLMEIQPRCFEEIAAIISLYRPGPMDYIPQYIDGKRNPKSIHYIDDRLSGVLENTYGVCCYQEQLMRMSQVIAGFTMSQADTLRKGVGKKIASILEEIKPMFYEGAKKNGTPKETIDALWELIEKAGKYSFNKSHGLAYAMVSYRTAWLKAHFPDAFLAAMCTIAPGNKNANIPLYLEDAKKMGVEIFPPHVNRSGNSFNVPEPMKIYFGLGGIKRVGQAADAIIEERERGGDFIDLTDFCLRVPKTVTKGSIAALIAAGALDGLGWTRKAMEENLDEIIEFRKSFFDEKKKLDRFEGGGLFGDIDFFGSTDNEGSASNGIIDEIKLIPPHDMEYSPKQVLKREKEMFGMYFSGDPRDFCERTRRRLEAAERARSNKAFPTRLEAKTLEENDPEQEQGKKNGKGLFINLSEFHGKARDKQKVCFFGQAAVIRASQTKKGDIMGTVIVTDNGLNEESRYGFSPTTYSVRCTCFPRTWEEMNIPREDETVFVEGRVNVDPEGKYSTAVIVDAMTIVPESDAEELVKANAEQMEKIAAEMEEIEKEKAELGDPGSARYVVPTFLFPNRSRYDAFFADPDTWRFKDGRDRCLFVIEKDEDDGGKKTIIEAMYSSTMGLVKQVERFDGKARKARLPQATKAKHMRELLG